MDAHSTRKAYRFQVSEFESHNPDNWEAGWDHMSQMLSEDEDWARTQFEAFHGREY